MVKVPLLTVTAAVAVPAAPVWAEIRLPVVLVWSPAATPVTFKWKLQEAFVARLAPDKLITPVTGVAVITPPPQLPARPLGAAITRPAGSVSLNPTPVSPMFGFGF